MENKFELIPSCLCKTKYFITKDQVVFGELERGEITLREAKERFMKNNDFPWFNPDVEDSSEKVLKDSLFKEWVQSLGWKVK